MTLAAPATWKSMNDSWRPSAEFTLETITSNMNVSGSWWPIQSVMNLVGDISVMFYLEYIH